MLAYLYRRRRYVKFMSIVAFVIWVTCQLIFHLTLWADINWSNLFDDPHALDAETLRLLMRPEELLRLSFNFSPVSQLSHIHTNEGNMLSFYDLPKRKRHVTYSEITSANRDTGQPLTPDFTFHLDYNDRHVTLYEDHGPGCIYRIFLYPFLPTDYEILHRLTPAQLSNLTLVLIIDGVTHLHGLDRLMTGSHAPFLYPLSTRHPTVASGVGAYTPICYQHSMVVKYRHSEALPADLLSLTINCTQNELTCPVKIYSAVSRHKFPYGSKVSGGPYLGPTSEKENRELLTVARRLDQPEVYGPDAAEDCVLECVELCAGCQRVLYHGIKSAGVISALKVRVLSTNGSPLVDWSDIFLSVYFDYATTAQINRVSLGSLFGASESLNDFKGAAYGRRSRYCSYTGVDIDLPYYSTTGYLYLPMPFWSEALVVLERSSEMEITPVVCFQLNFVENFYDPNETGYLNAVNTHYEGDVSRWRGVVDVREGWGHLVGVGLEVDHLRAARDVPLAERWATLQSDAVIYVDGVPAVLGTGLEDYFSYAHGFTNAGNTTYPFVGVYHGSPAGTVEPLTWHCYRQHILDAVTFRHSLQFVMEGTDRRVFSERSPALNHSQYRVRKRAGLTTLSHLALYYFHPTDAVANGHNTSTTVTHLRFGKLHLRTSPRQEHTVGVRVGERVGTEPSRKDLSALRKKQCDYVYFGDEQSEQKHSFQIVISNSVHTGSVFRLNSLRYVGDTAFNRTINVTGRAFESGDSFKFTMDVPRQKGSSSTKNGVLVLRRTFHSFVRQWNDEAKVSLNDAVLGTWFIPMGTLNEEYSVRVEEITMMMSPRASGLPTGSGGGGLFEIRIEPRTVWRDISYELCRA